MTQAQEVENQLRKMILDLEIGPGERVTERWAESHFSASRTPVRSALLRLEAEGLVCREGRGWMVSPIDLQEMEQLFVYREVLEVAALKLSANRIDEAELHRLEAIIDMTEAEKSVEAAQDAGTAFHLHLASLAGNAFITRGLEDALRRLSRVRWLDTRSDHPGWDEHRDILQALREQDTERALTVLMQHLQQSCERLTSTLRSSKRSLRASGITVE